MYNETYKVTRVVIIPNESMRPHGDVMCNTNIYKYQTSNGYHGFSLLDENMIAMDILSKGIILSTEFPILSTQDEKKCTKCKH